MWCEDEAGPYRTQPYHGKQWRPLGKPAGHDHEYFPNGTAKLLTLLEPKTGKVRVKGVTSIKNSVLHPWLKEQFKDVVDNLPKVTNAKVSKKNRSQWEIWQEGLKGKITLPDKLPPLRALLVLDNLAGHKSVEWVLWCFNQGIMLLFTPLGGSWLNMAESVQKILKERALNGTHPTQPEQIIEGLEAVADAWNESPTPFNWGGKRQQRRRRAYERRRRLALSQAYIEDPVIQIRNR